MMMKKNIKKKLPPKKPPFLSTIWSTPPFYGFRINILVWKIPIASMQQVSLGVLS